MLFLNCLILFGRLSLRGSGALRHALLLLTFLAALLPAAFHSSSAQALAGSSFAAVPPAQAESPNTPAARQLHAWLDAFNSGDRAVFLAFLEKNYPDDAKRIDGMMRFRSMTGGFELRKIEKSDDAHLSAILKEHDSDQFARFEIEVDQPAPNQS